ncbi:hypothetical protein [Rhodoferax saidenbachensis]|uniref:Type IV secretory pathway TrbL component n=1 Tax=Rhodoferax saidenbachensis TaxID=1484693 RepID=A0ABU1ZRV5_9BURK|nr:hypothetical protein [Rhodoferax saidenbachensis]MDR7308286.1 type IV secretory pathway TrbL component [Rhodoferax saidenbachensis]
MKSFYKPAIASSIAVLIGVLASPAMAHRGGPANSPTNSSSASASTATSATATTTAAGSTTTTNTAATSVRQEPPKPMGREQGAESNGLESGTQQASDAPREPRVRGDEPLHMRRGPGDLPPAAPADSTATDTTVSTTTTAADSTATTTTTTQ